MRASRVMLAVMASSALVAAAGEETFLRNTRQLTFEGRRSGEGYFSADGKSLVFQSEREAGNPFYQIYVLDLSSGEARRVSPGVGKTTCGFLRPGTDEVLFASTHLDPDAAAKQRAELEFRASGKQRRYAWDYDPTMDIFTAGSDGANPQRLTSASGYDAEGAYSPDGKKIVFCSVRDAYPTNQLSAADLKRLETDPASFGEIYIMNADGSGQRRLTHQPGYDGGPFFSPDGTRIVWRHFETNGVVADVYTMRTDGTDTRRVTDFRCMSWAPFYHPSGAYIIFTANKLGFSNFELYIANAEGGGEPVRVTESDGFDGLPTFSPDGKKIVWTSGRGADGASQLFMADWNHDAALRAIESQAVGMAKQDPNRAASLPAFDPIRMSNDVVYLASEELAGRFTGSKGVAKAAAFLAERLEKAGASRAGTSESYFHPFQFTSGVRVVTNQTALRLNVGQKTNEFPVEQDFRPLAFSETGSAEGEVVFAGYGLSVPGSPGEGYDSYAGLNVSNKVVLVLRYVPEAVEPKRRQELNRYAGLRYKAMLARERGAKAILFVTGPTSPGAGTLTGIQYDNSTAGSGILAASVSSNFVAALFSETGHDLKEVQAELDRENPHAKTTIVFTNAMVRISCALEHLRKEDRNVIAYLPAANGSREIILVGAHYDHLGHGESGAMLRKGEEEKIHPGADDNASGTAVVMSIAEALAARQKNGSNGLSRAVIFAFWSGEETGVIGSSQFAEKAPIPLSNIVACINFDMVGRLRDNKLMLQGVGSSPDWKRLIEKANVAAGFNAVLQEDPYLPTDVTPFYARRIPVLNFFTGSHDDYHRPTDTPEKLNYDGMGRIASFAAGIVQAVANSSNALAYAKVESARASGGSRDGLRAYLGTIPDYAAEVQGVKLSGVRGGSPAEKAGLMNGDVIVEFAGQKIANIYDYTYALDAVKIGQPIQVIIQRDGRLMTVSVTPEARK